MPEIRDQLLIRNQRIKLGANFLNAVGLGMIGFGLLRSATEDFELIGSTAVGWASGGLAVVALALYVLGYLKKEAVHER